MSEKKTNGVTKKLFEIQKLGLKYPKNASNPFYKSKYLDLDTLLEKLLPEANKAGLLISHHGMANSLVTAVTDVDTGEQVQSAFPLPEGADPQKMGSAITYAKRYNLGALFNIVTDADDDANSTVPKKEEEDLPF